MSEAKPDNTPLMWRLIPLTPPPFSQALLITLLALLGALALRAAFVGLGGVYSPSSSYFPAIIIASLCAGRWWGWVALAAPVTLGLTAPWVAPANAQPIGVILLFALSGAVTVLVSTALRDTLVRLRAEGQARADAEDLLRLVEEGSGLGLWEWDLLTGRSKWSPGVYANVGLPQRTEPPGVAALREWVHPDDLERLVAANSEAIRSGRHYEIDFRTRGPDGQVRWIHSHGLIARDETGRAIRVVGYNIDITERHLDAERLRDSEARFRALADSAPALMWVSRPGGAREFVNSAYIDFVGGTYEDAVHLDWRTRLDAEDLPRILKEQVAGETSRKPFQLEARYRRADGEWRWLRSFSQPRLGQDGEFLGFAGIAFDVTEAKAAEVRLQDDNELLQERVEAAVSERDQAQAALIQSQKLEALGQLTGGVAHDFNNLLAVVIGALDVLLRRPDDQKRIERLGKAALEAAQKGERLTRQLLAFSRRQPLSTETVRADEMLRESASLYSRALGERYVLDLDLQAGEALVTLDPVQLDAALMNLIVNARDAMQSGGVITLATALRQLNDRNAGDLRPGPYVAFEVRDAGAGMAPEVLARAFEPFFSTKEPGKGTGLGLSQVYGFARQSGGDVRIESQPGAGAAVSILLPVAAEGDAAAVAAPFEAAGAAQPLRILLVEDDPQVADLATAMLQELGHTVVFADTAAMGLKSLKADKKVQLLMTDIVMPGEMNGVDLARAAANTRPGLPILLCSGYTGEALQAAESGPWPLLRKPYTLDVLARALAEAQAAAVPPETAPTP